MEMHSSSSPDMRQTSVHIGSQSRISNRSQSGVLTLLGLFKIARLSAHFLHLTTIKQAGKRRCCRKERDDGVKEMDPRVVRFTPSDGDVDVPTDGASGRESAIAAETRQQGQQDMSNEREIQTLINDKKRAVSQCKWKQAAELCNFLGNKLSEWGQLDSALAEHEEELSLCQRLDDEAGCALAHRCIGEVCSQMQDYRRALKSLKLFLDISEKRKDVVEMQRAWATIGRTYLLKDDLKHAETAFKMALKLTERSASCHCVMCLYLLNSMHAHPSHSLSHVLMNY